MNVMSGFKALALSAVFSAMFLVGCEQPVSSVVAGDEVAMSYVKGSGDAILGGDKDGGPVKGNDKGDIFKKLNLTGEQRGQIEILRQQKIACEKAAKDVLKASERAIKESFSAQRNAINVGVKAGTITRDEASTQMRALEAAQKAAMEANPARAIAQAALLACRKTFNDGVGAILTSEQKVIWDDFLANPPAKDGDKGRDKGGDKGRDKGVDKGRDKGGDNGGLRGGK